MAHQGLVLRAGLAEIRVQQRRPALAQFGQHGFPAAAFGRLERVMGGNFPLQCSQFRKAGLELGRQLAAPNPPRRRIATHAGQHRELVGLQHRVVVAILDPEQGQRGLGGELVELGARHLARDGRRRDLRGRGRIGQFDRWLGAGRGRRRRSLRRLLAAEQRGKGGQADQRAAAKETVSVHGKLPQRFRATGRRSVGASGDGGKHAAEPDRGEGRSSGTTSGMARDVGTSRELSGFCQCPRV